jgi:hypothetical protein
MQRPPEIMITRSLSMLVVLAGFLCACSSSLTFSPSLNLPGRPLSRGESQLHAGGEYLLETRPRYAARYGVVGIDAGARYGFAESFALGIGTWYPLADEPYRGGVAVDAIVMLGDTSDRLRFGVIPRIAVLIDQPSRQHHPLLNALGISAAGLGQYRLLPDLAAYVALGPAIGGHDIDEDSGYGVIGNLGAVYSLSDRFEVGAELFGVVMHSVADDVTDGVAAPTVWAAFRF